MLLMSQSWVKEQHSSVRLTLSTCTLAQHSCLCQPSGQHLLLRGTALCSRPWRLPGAEQCTAGGMRSCLHLSSTSPVNTRGLLSPISPQGCASCGVPVRRKTGKGDQNKKKLLISLGVVAHACNPALGRLGQLNPCKFNTNLG